MIHSENTNSMEMCFLNHGSDPEDSQLFLSISVRPVISYGFSARIDRVKYIQLSHCLWTKSGNNRMRAKRHSISDHQGSWGLGLRRHYNFHVTHPDAKLRDIMEARSSSRYWQLIWWSGIVYHKISRLLCIRPWGLKFKQMDVIFAEELHHIYEFDVTRHCTPLPMGRVCDGSVLHIFAGGFGIQCNHIFIGMSGVKWCLFYLLQP